MSRSAVLVKAANVRMAVFDIDGVMTDGRLFFSDAGEQMKAFHVRDGLGLKTLMRHGIEVAVITARRSGIVERRMAELGIEQVMQGYEDKAGALSALLEEKSFGPEAVCYAGDDLVDWPAMRQCGLKCAPSDASAWIRERADHVCNVGGGLGAVREVCELVLEGHGHLDNWQDGYG